MNKKFCCDLCGVTCSSGYELAQHLQSKEHKDKVNSGTDSVIEKFIKRARELINESNKV